MLIHVNSAPCGAGKTHAQIQHAKSLADRGEHVMLVQPTRKLLRQTADGLAEAGCRRVTPICGEDADHGEARFSGGVVKRAMEHMQAPREGGEVMLLTHAAHQRLPYVHKPGDWHLVYDEAPQAVWCHALNVPDTHSIITAALRVEEFNPEYLRVQTSNRTRLQGIARNRNADDIFALLQPVANTLLSPHWDVCVDAEQYRNCADAHGDRRQLIFHGTIKPTLFGGYRSATVLAADAGETALVNVLAGKVVFRETRAFDRHLRYTQHSNGDLLSVEYLTEEDWSKNLRDKRAEDGRPFLDHAVEAIQRRFAGQPFAWMGNLDIKDDVFGDADATRLPNTAHGLNCYQHLHCAALLSALNPPPSHFAFLASIGVDSEAVRTALYRQSIYQAACRISLRDPADANPKSIVVPDRATAEWLAAKFDGCAVGAVDGVLTPKKGKPGRPRLHESAAIRNLRHREAERKRLLADVAALRRQDTERHRGSHTAGQQGEMPPSAGAEGAIPCGYGIPIREGFRYTSGGGDAAPPVFATLYFSLYDTAPAHHWRCAGWRDFTVALRAVWQDPISCKGDTARFIPADMDPAHSAVAAEDGADKPRLASLPGQEHHNGAAAPRSRRGVDNVRSAHLLVLDNDGGDLGKEEFARLLPWRMVVVNSYSSTPRAERWRALIPTDIPVSAELYRLFTGRLLKRLNRAGYWSKQQLAENQRIKSRLTHGFDMVKLGAASIFDLPSQAAAGADASFFLDFTEGREAIDVDRLVRWLDLRRDDAREAMDAAVAAFAALTPEQQEERARAARAAGWEEMSPEDRADFPEFDPALSA